MEFGILKTTLRYALCALVALFFLPGGTADAQGIFQGFSGLLEFNYSFASFKTTDSSGATTKTTSSFYNPRFTLAVSTDIFPKLKLVAGGVFEKDISIFKTDSESTKATLTRFNPYFYLTLQDPLYVAGIGYNRREETAKAGEGSGVTVVNNEYSANLTWRPDGFPSIQSQYVRTDTYDEKKNILDLTRDTIFLTSRYDYQGLSMRYNANYTDTQDKLNHLETKDLIQNAWVSYSNFFLNRRVSLSTSYNFSYDETTTSQQGTGNVGFQIFPSAGLSFINSSATPITVTPLTLDTNPALIDGNTTSSANIPIGPQPPPNADTLRQVGLDFTVPTELNQLLLWIDQDLSTATSVRDFFISNIKVYQSPDNLNWTQVGPIPPVVVTFGQFQNRFEINFGSSVTTRYIKVVTPPLSSAVPGATSFPNIFITELQAFLLRPAAEVRGKTTRTSHLYNLDVAARLLDIPTLYYNLSYFFNRIDPSGQQRYVLSNGLSVNQRFTPVLFGRARVAIENGKEIDQTRLAYIYDASLETTPLNTLTNRLTFSGRNETVEGNTSSLNSIFLYNIAELYKGLSVNLNGGVNFLKNETGQDSTETNVSFSASVIPHPTVNLGLAYIYSKIDQSGGGLPSSTNFTHTANVTLTYNPFQTLYLVASIEVIADGQKVSTEQNYGLNWSPFPDGALQFRFFYNESLESLGSGKSRTISPGVRWYITKRSYLDVSYQLITNESSSGKSDSNIIGATLKIFL